MEPTSHDKITVEPISIATNLNTVFGAFDYSAENDLIAYASANLICIMTLEKQPKVLFTLNGHKDRVNSVRWLSKTCLLSVSADKTIRQWRCEGDVRNWDSWKNVQTVEAGTKSVNYLKVLKQEAFSFVLTGSLDGNIKLFTFAEQLECVGQLSFGANIQEAMALIVVADDQLLITLGGYDKLIHVYRVTFDKSGKISGAVTKSMKYLCSL